MRLRLAVRLLPALVFFACGGTDGNADAGISDGGSSSDAALDSAVDGGAGAIAFDVCPGGSSVISSGDGFRVAYLDCATDPPKLVVQSLVTGAVTEIAEVEAGTEVEFSPGDEYLVYGTEGAYWVRRSDASGPAVALSEEKILAYRFVDWRQGASIVLRLLVVEEAGTSVSRVRMRSETDEYASETDLTGVVSIVGGLELVSESGQTLVFQVLGDEYRIVPTDGSEMAESVGFGPGTSQLTPNGMDDMHALGVGLGQLRLRRLVDTASNATLVASDVPDNTPVYVLDDDGSDYVYCIADGDIVRHARDGTGDTEVLATANAATFFSTKDGSRIVYLSNEDFFSVTMDGSSEPVQLMTAVGAFDEVEVVGSPDSSTFAVRVDSGELRRASTTDSGTQVILTDQSAFGGTAGYNDSGSHLLWIQDIGPEGEGFPLRAIANDETEATTLATAVAAWWPLKESSDILYRTTAGELRRLDL